MCLFLQNALIRRNEQVKILNEYEEGNLKIHFARCPLADEWRIK